MNEVIKNQEKSQPVSAEAEVKPVRPLIGGSYWFSPLQKEIIGRLGGYMRVAAIVSIVFGVLESVLAFLSRQPGTFFQGAVLLVIGWITFKIAGNFKQVIEERDQSMHYLMRALGGLKLLYIIQVWTLIIFVGFLIVFLLRVLVFHW